MGSKVEPFKDLIGKIPDAEIAEMAGVKIATVQKFAATIEGVKDAVENVAELVDEVEDVIDEVVDVIRLLRSFRTPKGTIVAKGLYRGDMARKVLEIVGDAGQWEKVS